MAKVNGNTNVLFSAYICQTDNDMKGQWIDFPSSKDKIRKVFEKRGWNHPTDYYVLEIDCPDKQLSTYLDELAWEDINHYPPREIVTINELHYFACRYQSLKTYEQDQLKILISGMPDILFGETINLTYNIDKFEYGSANDLEEIGKKLLRDEFNLIRFSTIMLPSLDRIRNQISQCIDFKAYGKLVAEVKNYTVSDLGYFKRREQNIRNAYDGYPNHIPPRYCVEPKTAKNKDIDFRLA